MWVTPIGISVNGPASAIVSPADVARYTVQLSTDDLPVGPYETRIPVRTSDPGNPASELVIRGEITAGADDTAGPVLWCVRWTCR